VYPLQPTITLVKRKLSAVLDRHTFEAGPALERVVFFLQKGPGDRCFFYECSEPGCVGCGCPSFQLDERLLMPESVFDHLRRHLEVNHETTYQKGN
jgi:hypothetical protein